MAAFRGVAITPEVSLTAETATTVLQVKAPANHIVSVERVGIYFNGTTVTNEPVLVELVRQSTAGTMTALTPKKLNDSLSETLQTTAQHSATSEPTTGDVIDMWLVHPQGGWEVPLPLTQEHLIGGDDRLGVRCTAPETVSVRAKLAFEE